MFEDSNTIPSEIADADARKLKEMHEKECRELRLTIKSLVRINQPFYRSPQSQNTFLSVDDFNT
jgi:hypothetical protein